MILSALNDYYGQLAESDESGIALPGYSSEKISYEIVLDRDGNVVAVNDLRELDGKKAIPKVLPVPASFKRPGTGAKPFFLWDKTSYVLGISATSKRCDQEHAAFNELHKQALAGTCDEGLLALLTFLQRWTLDMFGRDEYFAKHGEDFLDSNVVFRLYGDAGPDGKPRHIHQRPAAKAVWSRLQSDDDSSTGMCLVIGEQASIARLHPAIKGVNGAQSMGASIVSFNLDAFTSYGKSQGENAPISTQAAFAYTTALNHLLRRSNDNRQRLLIGDATVVFWAYANIRAKAEAAESLFAAFLDPKAGDERETEKLNNALHAVKHGLPLRTVGMDLLDDTRICVLGLAPNASRLSIRFWEIGMLQSFAQRLAQHYDDLRLEPLPWRTPPPIWRLQLTVAPSRDGPSKQDDVPPQLAGELMRAVLTGARYPYYLLGMLIMRMRNDGDISGLRVALCKAVLARAIRLGHKGNSKGAPPVSLDSDNRDPGYLLGRLFSVLENAQRAALGKEIVTTMRDRYYGSASAAPASVFPVLMRNAQHHLARVRKDKPGFAVQLETDIGTIVGGLGTSFPRSLGIEAQGHFAIGYYHQTQARFVSGRNRRNENDSDNQESAGETA